MPAVVHRVGSIAAVGSSVLSVVLPSRAVAWRTDTTDATGATGSGVVVAVLEAPDNDHPSLAGHVLDGINIALATDDEHVDGTEFPTNHGTAVAGAVLSIAPGAEILAVDPDDPTVDGDGSIEDVGEAIRWAVEHGADVINVSLATPHRTAFLANAIDYATDHGVLVIAGAGNTGSDNPACRRYRGFDETEPNTVLYPAGYDDVFAVGGLDSPGQIWECSQSGDHVDGWADATDVRLPVAGAGFETLSGTSYAAPQVAGLAALVLEILPGLPPQQLAALLARATGPDRGADRSRVDTEIINTLADANFEELAAALGEDGRCSVSLVRSPTSRELTLSRGGSRYRAVIDGGAFSANGPHIHNGFLDLPAALWQHELHHVDNTAPGPTGQSLSVELWLGTSPNVDDYDPSPHEIDDPSGRAIVIDPGPDALPLTPDAHRARGVVDAGGSHFFGGPGCIRSEGLGGGLRRDISLHQSLHIPAVGCVPAGSYFLVASPRASTLRDAEPIDPGWWQAGTFPAVTVSEDVEAFLCADTGDTATRPAGGSRSWTAPITIALTGAGVAVVVIRSRTLRRPRPF